MQYWQKVTNCCRSLNTPCLPPCYVLSSEEWCTGSRRLGSPGPSRPTCLGRVDKKLGKLPAAELYRRGIASRAEQSLGSAGLHLSLAAKLPTPQGATLSSENICDHSWNLTFNLARIVENADMEISNHHWNFHSRPWSRLTSQSGLLKTSAVLSFKGAAIVEQLDPCTWTTIARVPKFRSNLIETFDSGLW